MKNQTIGEFIAVLRKSKGMTQKQLAEILSVSDKTISHWERNESSPDLSMIPIIAEVFSVSCDELLRGEKNPDSAASDIDFTLSDKGEKRYYYFLNKKVNEQKIVSIVCLFLTVFALIIGFMLCKKFVIACHVTLIICLVSSMIGLVCYTDTANKIGSYEEFDSDKTKRYRQKLSAYLAYPLMLNLLAASISINFLPYYIIGRWYLGVDLVKFLSVVVPLIICAVTTYCLMKKGKLYVKPRSYIFRLRAKTILIYLLLFTLGTGFFWAVDGLGFDELTTDFTVYRDPGALVQYMEKIEDGVHPTAQHTHSETLDGEGNNDDPNVHTLYNPETGEVWARFRWNNKNVSDVTEYYERASFVGFEVHTLSENKDYIVSTALHKSLVYAVPVYYVAITLLTILIYNRKKKKETT